MNTNSKIYISGHKGLVGSAVVRALKDRGFTNLILKTHKQLELLDDKLVADFFVREKPEYVFMVAAKVGGILANRDYSAEFIYENLKVQNNIIHNAYLSGVKKLLFLRSSCIYPRNALQPIKEEYLLTNELEPTNEAYAIAKIAGIKMCQSYNKQYGTNFICAMPTNLYGINDNFDQQSAHVLPALIRKFYDAKIKNKKKVTIWGTGTPRREFLYVDDLASALVFLMEKYNETEIINVGVGEDITIIDLAKKIASIIGFKGEIVTDISKPDGMPRKLLNVSRLLNLGWKPRVSLDEGIDLTYQWYIKNKND